MANLLSEFVDGLASQSGIDTQSDDYIKFIQDKRLSDIVIPENILKSIHASMLTPDSAKNHKDIAGHFKVKYYKTIEGGLNRALKTAGVPDEFITEIGQEADTLKRLELAIPKLIEYSKGLNNGTTEDSTKYKSLLTKYQEMEKKLGENETSWSQKEQKWNSDLEQKEIQWEVDNHLSAYQFSDILPAEDAKFLIKKKIQDGPFVLKKVDGKLGVYQKENPDLAATEKNKPLTVKDILDVNASPYIKKAASAAPATPGGKTTVGAPAKTTSNSTNKAIDANAQKLAELKQKGVIPG